MFKNIVIGVLIIVLLITIYSYICVVNSMEDFQKQRFDFVINKEKELKERESKIIESEKCTTELNNCNNIVNTIKNSIHSTAPASSESK